MDSSMSIKIKKMTMLQCECRICGAPADHSNFGVISCNSCKIFFRRHAERSQFAFVCNFNDQCEINIHNRHECKSCRLAKCFKSGMITDKFRGPIPKRAKITNTVALRLQQQPQRLPTLNLLQSDQSLLTTDQWTLLSNLFHCYNESQVLPFTQRLIDVHNATRSTGIMYQLLVEELLASIYEATGAYLRSNEDIRRLPFDDRSVILPIAANNVCCISSVFVMQCCLLYGLDTFLSVMSRKYGRDTMDIHIWASQFIDQDVTLIKLAISLFAFSGNTLNDLTNSLHSFKIQNKYADVTWKYLLYRYGFRDAIKRFLNLTHWLTSIHILAVHAQSLAPHVNDIDSVIEETELKLILDDIDEIVETDQ